MKNLIKLSALALATMFVVSSCNLEKRLYMKGYHFEAKKNKVDKSDKLAHAKVQTSNEVVLADKNVNEINTNFESKLIENNTDNQFLASTDNKISNSVEFNNTKEVELAPISTLSNKESKIVLKESKKSAKEFVKSIKKEAAPRGGGSDKTTLILLWVFLGGFAAHRWYAGKPVGANILFILTAGGCMVWAIIDLIKILKDEF